MRFICGTLLLGGVCSLNANVSIMLSPKKSVFNSFCFYALFLTQSRPANAANYHQHCLATEQTDICKLTTDDYHDTIPDFATLDICKVSDDVFDKDMFKFDKNTDVKSCSKEKLHGVNNSGKCLSEDGNNYYYKKGLPCSSLNNLFHKKILQELNIQTADTKLFLDGNNVITYSKQVNGFTDATVMKEEHIDSFNNNTNNKSDLLTSMFLIGDLHENNFGISKEGKLAIIDLDYFNSPEKTMTWNAKRNFGKLLENIFKNPILEDFSISDLEKTADKLKSLNIGEKAKDIEDYFSEIYKNDGKIKYEGKQIYKNLSNHINLCVDIIEESITQVKSGNGQPLEKLLSDKLNSKCKENDCNKFSQDEESFWYREQAKHNCHFHRTMTGSYR